MSSAKLKKLPLAFFLSLCLCMSTFIQVSSAGTEQGAVLVEQQPVNPEASYEAKALLSYLYNISGKGIISGQFNYTEAPDYWTNRAVEITGKQPALWGADFSFYFGIDLEAARQEIVDTAIEQWKNGSIVTLCFHEQFPGDPWDQGWTSVQSHRTDSEMDEILTPGTPLYNKWLADIDNIAEYLKQLRDSGVPVIWRPYHEGNAWFFWWGGRPEVYKQLFKNMYDRFTNYHHLNNLLWQYGPASNNEWAEPVVDFYPGAEYVDILSVDIYDSFKIEYYNEMLDVAGGKPIAIGECGSLPDIGRLQADQPLYTYYMAWGKMLEESNTIPHIQEVYAHPYTLNAEDLNIPLQANLVSNPEFDKGTGDWTMWLKDGAEGYNNVVTDGGLSGTNSLCIRLTNAGTGIESAGISQPFTVENGKTYNISFQAKAAEGTTIEAKLAGKQGEVYWSQTVEASTGRSTFGPYTFVSGIEDKKALLQFSAGGGAKLLWLDNICIKDGSPASPGTFTEPPVPGEWVTVDDRDKYMKFSGSWIREEASRDWNEGHIYSNSVNSYAEYTFEGTAVEYIGSRQGDLGFADIYIDGVKDASVDLYKPGDGLPRAVLYEKTGLNSGRHTIKVAVNGEKNPSAADCKVELDAIKYLYEPAPTPTPPPTPTPTPEPTPKPTPILENLVGNSDFDNGDSDWYWLQSGDAIGSISVVTDGGLSGDNALKATLENGGTDPWNAQINQNLPVENGKTYTISFMAKADAPRDMSVVWQQGEAPYTGLWYQEVSLTTEAQTFGPYTFTASADDPGAALRFNLGGNATGVYIDKVVITDGTIYVPPLPSVPDNTWGIVDDRDIWVNYSGFWVRDLWEPDYNGTESYTNSAGSEIEFTFNGTGVQYISYKQHNLGIVDIYIDGVLETSLDLYNPGGTGPVQFVLFEKTGMASGSHTIKLVVTGDKNPDSTGVYVVLDAFKYINEVP